VVLSLHPPVEIGIPPPKKLDKSFQIEAGVGAPGSLRTSAGTFVSMPRVVRPIVESLRT
jgi:hypothetical protein